MRHLELYKYNPSRADIQELEDTLVGRECLIDEILAKLQDQIPAKSNQNFLIIGPRGIGKTYTLLILRHRIQNDTKLSRKYLPISFAEEEYSIITLRDFFEKILDLLRQIQPQEDLLTAFDVVHEEEDPDVATERAIKFLKEFAHRNKRKLLLFIDNFDLIFSDQIRQDSAVRRFRDVLMNDNFLLILGSAPTYFEEVMGYDQPLYNFFKIYDLDEFDMELTEILLQKRAELDNNAELFYRLGEFRPKLEALHRLTGGNPRLILMLYQLLVFAEFPEVKAALSTLLDDLTPYYKHKIECITSRQQRKIIDTMARLDHAVTPTELAAATRLPVNQVSSLLKRLQSDGYVKPAKQKKRKATFYIITERLFRIWHQMRYSSDPYRRLPFLVEFVSLWYSLKELKEEYSRLENRFLSAIEHGQKADAMGVLEHLGYLAEAAPTGQLKNSIFESTIRHYLELGEWETAKTGLQQELKQSIKDDDLHGMVNNYFLLGVIYFESAKNYNDELLFLNAFDNFDKAIALDSDRHEVWNKWGIALGYLALLKNDEILFQQACRKFEQAVTLKPDMHEAWYNWGTTLGNLAELKGDEVLFEQAFEKYDRAVRIKPDMHEAWYNWGFDLGDLARMKGDEILFQQAFEKYDRVVAIKPNDYEAWFNWGNALGDLARLKGDEALFQQALEKYDRVASIKPDMLEVWSNWGTTIGDLARLRSDETLFRLALEKFKQAITIKQDMHEAWNGIGIIHAYRDEFDKASEYFKKAFNILMEEKPKPTRNNYAHNLILGLLHAAHRHIVNNNIGGAKDRFQTALEFKEFIDERHWQKRLVHFFDLLVSEQRVPIFFEFQNILKENSLREEIELLKPFAIACEYWQKDQDAEVLDRLNPEMREVVEDVIRKSESKKDSGDEISSE